MNLYLDTCCYSRPFDDQGQERIYLESEAVLSIVKRGRLGKDIIVGSDVLELEMSMIANVEKRDKITILYQIATTLVRFSSEIEKRAKAISEKSSIRSFDALHIACAEYGEVDYMLTTDDKLKKAADKQKLSIEVVNPLTYMAEVMKSE
ncbi:MAG: PIN domain-containing protein [Clostridiales Family XIII bacterium]|nr:PIN domain-containing protein [Clostridiales Family XIII bacterium]